LRAQRAAGAEEAEDGQGKQAQQQGRVVTGQGWHGKQGTRNNEVAAEILGAGFLFRTK
jgi:hypothetical protein